MRADVWRRVEELFHRALALPWDERAAFVEAETSDDDALRQEVSGLLRAHLGTHPLLDAPPVSSLPPGMRLGPYALERVLGAGGMGTVYLARRVDRQFEKHVAIKLVNQGLAAEVSGSRFSIERQILARLEHPNIARLLDAGLSEFGQPYLVMEWVDGVSLDVWRRQTRTLDQRLDLFLSIAAAVGYAHRNLIVHRDLKPTNVLVTAEGVPKLVDFGVAALLSDEGRARASHTQPFTLNYASPEQIRGDELTTATDIYSLGLLLYELIVGEHPFGRCDAPHEQAEATLHHDVTVPTRVPTDLAAVIGMALRKPPERRYASTDHFADDVRRFRRGLPVAALPESAGYRLRRFAMRHRWPVAASAAAAASLIALTVLAISQARAADAQRARAEQVTELITGFLGASPTGLNWALANKGASLRVMELADFIAGRIDRELGNQPDAEVTLREVLAAAYHTVGDLDTSQHHIDRALELAADLYSPGDARRLRIDLLRASILGALGDFARAERELRRVRAEWLNPPLFAEAAIASGIGTAEFRQGRLEAAEQTFAAGIQHLHQRAGPTHPQIALLASNLSLVYIERGEFERAASELERSVAISRANFSEASIPLGWALVNLANVYRFLGESAKVLRTATESYDQMRATMGDSHYSLIHPLALMAYGQALARDPAAEDTIRRGLALQHQLPPDHHERAVGLTFLGFVLAERGRLDEARTALERALAIRHRQFQAPNWRIAETAGLLGEVLARQGDTRTATRLLQESVQAFEAIYGATNVRTTRAQAALERWAKRDLLQVR
jgi:serine/threonine-protein kinase